MPKTKTKTTYSKSDFNLIRNSNLASSIAEQESMRFDSVDAASLFFARELDHIKSRTYDVLYPEFNALNLFPTTSEADPGAESITYYGYDKVAIAKIIANYSTDLPRADATGKPTTAYIKSIGDSYGYSVQEMRASRLVNKGLDTRRGEAAKYGIDYLTNKIAWCGDEEANLVGVLSIGNNVPVFALPNGAAGSTKFVNKTPMECLNDINAMVAYTATLTKSVERPDTLALPSDAYFYLANTPMVTNPGTGAVGTIMSWILDNNARIKNIVEVPELNEDSDMTPYPGQGVGFMFSNDPNKFTVEIPMPFYQHPVQPENLEMKVPCEARVAGVLIYYPLSMLVIPGI